MNTNQEKQRNAIKILCYGILVGLVILGSSYFVYQDAYALEQGERLPRYGKNYNFAIKVLFNLGGKWLPPSIFAIIGLGNITISIRDFLKNKS